MLHLAVVTGRSNFKIFLKQSETSMLVLIVGQKWALAASHAAPGEARWVCRGDRQADGQTDGCQTVTLRFPLDAASVIRSWLRQRDRAARMSF